jgi:hypothetical protein
MSPALMEPALSAGRRKETALKVDLCVNPSRPGGSIPFVSGRSQALTFNLLRRPCWLFLDDREHRRQNMRSSMSSALLNI